MVSLSLSLLAPGLATVGCFKSTYTCFPFFPPDNMGCQTVPLGQLQRQQYSFVNVRSPASLASPAKLMVHVASLISFGTVDVATVRSAAVLIIVSPVSSSSPLSLIVMFCTDDKLRYNEAVCMHRAPATVSLVAFNHVGFV
uniref:Uncharacterized protein n=1 Tax=Branchiostoma floridae TaxID=7739 RepID=C3YW87_BRAFL|eukprot:XP_002599404.1 hypothetical protein BRAFLDRAFT_102674 [Branchiostoma floridae]